MYISRLIFRLYEGCKVTPTRNLFLSDSPRLYLLGVKEMTDQDKIERYDLIVGYFSKILQKRADNLQGEQIYYDGWKNPRNMDETEREEEVVENFIYEMDNIGFSDFAELMAHEFCGERISENNQFYDHVYGDRPCSL